MPGQKRIVTAAANERQADPSGGSDGQAVYVGSLSLGRVQAQEMLFFLGGLEVLSRVGPFSPLWLM